MKNFKLFLLGGIFSLLSIGSFSSAALIGDPIILHGGINNISVVNDKYNPNTFYTSFPLSELTFTTLSDSTCYIYFWTAKESDIWGYSAVEKIYQYVGNGSFSIDTGYVGWLQVQGPGGLKCDFQIKVDVPFSIEGSLSSFISNYYLVILEFVPYVVYISIGLLLCTICFYAIKWLVNWMSNGINSKFSSKRG